MPRIDSSHARYRSVVIIDGAGNYLQLPSLTTTQRDALSAVNGMLVYNSTTAQIESYAAGSWVAIGAGGLATHAALKTGVHGAGSNYLSYFPAADALVNRTTWLATPQQILSSGTPTGAGEWTTLDATAETSALTKFLILRLRIIGAGDSGDSGSNTLRVRPYLGSTAACLRVHLSSAQPNWAEANDVGIVEVNTVQAFDYESVEATGAAVTFEIYILGYIE